MEIKAAIETALEETEDQPEYVVRRVVHFDGDFYVVDGSETSPAKTLLLR